MNAASFELVRETRARRRIRRAVESRGCTLVSLEWQPPFVGGEMEGLCGGWYGMVTHPPDRRGRTSDDVIGLSVDQAVAWVDQFFKPSESCECPNKDRWAWSDPLSAPLHEPTCKWHLKYHLPWWPKVAPSCTTPAGSGT